MQSDLYCIFVLYTESDIDEFLHYYRSTFPHSTITPKLHMVEDHILEFIHLWKVGLGLLAEQGAESIHATFNTLERTYCNMPNRLDRLKSMVTEHYRQTHPRVIGRQPPPPQKRKKIVH